jgi:hypothetical protein
MASKAFLAIGIEGPSVLTILFFLSFESLSFLLIPRTEVEGVFFSTAGKGGGLKALEDEEDGPAAADSNSSSSILFTRSPSASVKYNLAILASSSSYRAVKQETFGKEVRYGLFLWDMKDNDQDTCNLSTSDGSRISAVP